jgi:hypothetical protein
MIRLTCPGCGSQLNAKDELVGQTRKCPKCGHPVQIVAPLAANHVGPDETPNEQRIEVSTDEALPSLELPVRLNRDNHYVICDKTHVVATWQNNGDGWMFKRGAGFASAKRNRDSLPAEGDFKLIELKFAKTSDGRRLTGLAVYQLVARWALTVLHEGDDQIVEKITDHGSLNRDQKYAVRQALRDQFMRQVWENAADVLEYLANADYHSSNVG